jgi:biopolymer transport protein ExbB
MWLDILDRLADGGPLMIPIAGVSLLAWAFIFERWLWLRRAGDPGAFLRRLPGGADAQSLRALCIRDGGLVGRAAGAALGRAAGKGGEAVADLMHEAFLKQVGTASRGLSAIALFASLAPLLGLLGTVTGMIGTFDAITLYGTGNPRMLADGIAEALITTQAGLIVALPVLLAHNVLARRIARFRSAAGDVFERIRSSAEAGPGGMQR